MAISTNDAVLKFGTYDLVSSGTPSQMNDGVYAQADAALTAVWTNSEDCEFAAAVLQFQFTTTVPAAGVGSVDLLARLMYLDSITDATCDLTNANTTVKMDDTSVLAIGMSVTGTSIDIDTPGDTFVASITNSTDFVVSRAPNGTATNETLTFKRNAPAPDANYLSAYVGSFPLDAGATAGDDYVTTIPIFRVPSVTTAQRIDWFLRNNSTGETITSGWQLWIAPKTSGPM